MKARLVYHTKEMEENGDIAEIKIWEVSVAPDKPHGFKYSLVFIHKGERVIGYDNAEQKGDHRHIGTREFEYQFKSIKRLFEDFLKDVKRFKEGKPR